ncbi:MAG: hypothetical protein ACREMR_04930 [Gemmatimonadales bacterium]
MKRAVGRSAGRAVGVCAVAMLVLTARPPDRLSAQADTTRPALPPLSVRVVAPDTLYRIKPLDAFWRSLVLPGWGQARAGRHVAGAMFVAWEGVTIAMTVKAKRELAYMEEIGSGNVEGKRQEVQDWLVLLIFNHLMAGAEAFVSAHLQDFPEDLKLQAIPAGVGVSLPLPRP